MVKKFITTEILFNYCLSHVPPPFQKCYVKTRPQRFWMMLCTEWNVITLAEVVHRCVCEWVRITVLHVRNSVCVCMCVVIVNVVPVHRCMLTWTKHCSDSCIGCNVKRYCSCNVKRWLILTVPYFSCSALQYILWHFAIQHFAAWCCIIHC